MATPGRTRPVDITASVRELTDFSHFCETASAFWRVNVLPADERIILVEAMSQDLRVTLRNLTVANALRRIEPARLVVYSGADEDWNQIVWTYFNLEEIRQMAIAYGAEVAFDAHELVDHRVRGNAEELVVAGVDLGGELPDAKIPGETFDQIVYATTCRMARVARLDDSPEHQAKRKQVEARSHEFARIYDALIERNEVVALISSHVDYNNFGLAVEAAVRHDVPVLFPQSTGGLKSYALFPEKLPEGMPIRAGLTDQIGEFFEEHIWANRELLERPRELTMWRAKATLGRPSWWRPGRGYSSVDLRGADDRSVVRTYAARRIGMDASRPVVSVFNHAVSDALGTNVEAFSDLGAWFEETAEFAATHDEVNWLFLDHPQQAMYDASDFFGRLGARHTDDHHMTFMRSMDLSKNFLTALTDLVLTVRGSVSNEYPALGIPALQSGWSEWSKCGFTVVAETPEDYFRMLKEHIDSLLAGEVLITPEQVERARLWAWFYRSGSDVPSGLVQQWQVGEGDELFKLLSINMLQTEVDAEPAFTAVRRMWRRRDPFLTRIDWRHDQETIADLLAPVSVQ
jgi:hypothetical protein